MCGTAWVLRILARLGPYLSNFRSYQQLNYLGGEGGGPYLMSFLEIVQIQIASKIILQVNKVLPYLMYLICVKY